MPEQLAPPPQTDHKADPDPSQCIEANGAAKKKKRNRKKKKDKGKDQEDGADGDEMGACGPEEEEADPEAEPLLGQNGPTGGNREGSEPWLHMMEKIYPIPEEFVDITGDFELATAGMQVGEMIESPNFRLYDAMSAIEIMDPKMDSGFRNHEDMTLEKAVATGVVAPDLNLEDLAAVCDQLLMYFLLWLEGHSIVQTIFSCLYLHDLEALVKPVPFFGIFVDAFLATCRCARDAVLRASLFEDEDFFPSLFNVDLQACVFSSDPNEIVTRIERECKDLVKMKSQAAQAMASRLDFMGQYMLALLELTGGVSRKSFEATKSRLAKCSKLVSQMSGSAKPASATVLGAFDASISRKLLVPGPPRTVKAIQDHSLVFARWSTHLQELTMCCSLMQKALFELLDGAIVLKDEPGVLARSIAQLVIADSGCMRELILQSLTQFLFPLEALQHCKENVEAFLERCEALMMHLLKLAHTNRARRFRRLAHVFADFNALQHEAWQLDDDLRGTFCANLRYQRPCWVWIMEICLQMMLKKLFLGFELELYDQAECHMIYWYADYLYGLRVFNLGQICYAKEQAQQGDKKKKSGSIGRAQQDKARGGQTKPRNPPASLLLLEATQNTVRGLFRLLALCLREGLTKLPSSGVDGLAQRFVLRFRPLEHFRLPHLPSYKDFQVSLASAQQTLESRVVLDAALESFKNTSELIDKVLSLKDKDGAGLEAPFWENAKALKRVVVANQLVITQLSQSLFGPTPNTVKVIAAPIHHPHLISVQVVKNSK